MGHNPVNPGWQHEVGGAAQNLGFFGANPHPNPAHPIQLDQFQQPNQVLDHQGDAMLADDGWDQFVNPPEQQNNAHAMQQFPQHPIVPQDLIDVDSSGSTIQFLRAMGADIPIQMVFGPANSDDDSSSSSDASSQPNDELEKFLRFAAANNRSINQLVFDRRGLPDGFQLQGSVLPLVYYAPAFQRPIVIDANLLQAPTALVQNYDTETQPSGLEIVPWQPVGASIAMHVIADYIEHVRRLPRIAVQEQVIQLPGIEHVSDQPVSSIQSRDSSLSLQVDSQTDSFSSSTQDPVSSLIVQNLIPIGPGPEFDFQTGNMQPNPASETPTTRPRGRHRSRAPIVDTEVGRSPRIRGVQEGYKHVHLGKRQRREVALLSIPESEGPPNPIPIEMLRSWGISCGVAPSELTDEALTEAPGTSTQMVPNEE